jgi:flagellar basal body-associated protein FliL
VPKVITFQEAIEQSKNYKKRHLLLGNGFSIAYKHDIFTYNSLLDETNFSKIPEVLKVFKKLNAIDFEALIKALEQSSKIVSIYSDDTSLENKLNKHSIELKTALVHTLASKHPEAPYAIGEEQYKNVRNFLSNFLGTEEEGNVYTLNYDLLLYWAIMHEEDSFGVKYSELTKGDGFGKEVGNINTDYVVWQGETNAYISQRIHYLHGALHLYDSGNELKKFTWINTGRKLIEQAKDAMDKNMYPLFVAEGTSEQKLTKIKHSAFLYHSYKSFYGMMNQAKNCLFIYGHSLAVNDMHILQKIALGKVPQIFISIYGDIKSIENQKIVSTANALVEDRMKFSDNKNTLLITFYDAKSATVW